MLRQLRLALGLEVKEGIKVLLALDLLSMIAALCISTVIYAVIRIRLQRD